MDTIIQTLHSFIGVLASSVVINISDREDGTILKTIVFIVTASIALTIVWFSRSKMRNEKIQKYPPYLLSVSGEDNSYAGLIETISGMNGLQSHSFIYNSMKKIPPGQPWVRRLNVPVRLKNQNLSTMSFLVADAEIIREILKDPNSSKPGGYNDFDMITDGNKTLFSANGTRWKHSRKHIASAFSSKHIKRMNKICTQKLSFWIDHTLNPLAAKGASCDICKEMLHLTMDIISEAAFDYQMPTREKNELIDNLEIALKEFFMQHPLHRLFPFLYPQVSRAKKASEALMRIVFNILDNYKANENPNTEDTIISRIVNNPKYKSDDERAADILIMFVGGYDTTSYSIAWTLLEVARVSPPELFTYREKIAKLPIEEWKSVDELHYMIKESMRLHPVAAFGVGRRLGKDVEFTDDAASGTKLMIPKNEIAVTSFYSMFRNPKYYKNPDMFQPSRWTSADGKKEEMELAHIPFALGHRSCVGQALALAELRTVLSTLLAKYDFKIEDEGSVEMFVTLKPVGLKLVPHKLPHE